MTKDLTQNLEKIRMLTDTVIPFMSTIRSITDSEIIYECPGGELIGQRIFNNEKVAIVMAIAKGNPIYPSHRHAETEYLLVVDGGIDIMTDTETVNCVANDVYLIKPNTTHQVVIKDMTTIIGITIPAAKGY